MMAPGQTGSTTSTLIPSSLSIKMSFSSNKSKNLGSENTFLIQLPHVRGKKKADPSMKSHLAGHVSSQIA